MKLLRIAAISLLTVSAPAQLPAVLSKLDSAAAGFQNAAADVRYDNYTKVVRDHTIQTGAIYIERASKTNTMGAIFRDEGSNTIAKILNYDGGKLQIYTPGTNQVDVFSAGANQARYESFLTLGFGGSGKDLAANWNITDLGPDAQLKVEKLDLVPKDPSVKNLFTHVTIWIDLARGLSVRQIFYQPNGDTRTADYSNLRSKIKIDTKPYLIPKKGPQFISH